MRIETKKKVRIGNYFVFWISLLILVFTNLYFAMIKTVSGISLGVSHALGYLNLFCIFLIIISVLVTKFGKLRY